MNQNTINCIDKLKNYTAKYQNPANHQEISSQIKECKTIGDVKALVDKIFPEWFVTVMPCYSNDYPQLQANWEKSNPTIAQIMIVEDVEQGDDYTLIREFAECFAAAGFQIRRKMEFIPCSVCSRALPSIMLHKYMQEKNMATTPHWADKCTTC